MKWRSMKTAPRDGTTVWLTLQSSSGRRWITKTRYPYYPGAIAWADDVDPDHYTGTLEELDAEVES